MHENRPFGDVNASNLQIGDIVEWSSWNEQNDCWDYNYGIITDIKNEIRSNRMVSISKVLPLNGERTEIEHFSISLRMVSRSGKLDKDNG